MEARLTVLGHVQRGGSPTVRDRLMAHNFAVGAIEALNAGKTDAIMVYREGEYGYLPIQEVCDSKYVLDPKLLNMSSRLCR
jgi:6-phosphofructokinase 1